MCARGCLRTIKLVSQKLPRSVLLLSLVFIYLMLRTDSISTYWIRWMRTDSNHVYTFRFENSWRQLNNIFWRDEKPVRDSSQLRRKPYLRLCVCACLFHQYVNAFTRKSALIPTKLAKGWNTASMSMRTVHRTTFFDSSLFIQFIVMQIVDCRWFTLFVCQTKVHFSFFYRIR